MNSVIVWCTVFTFINYDCDSNSCPLHETVAKGIVLNEDQTKYRIDFSNYASKQDYYGDWSMKIINKDLCFKE